MRWIRDRARISTSGTGCDVREDRSVAGGPSSINPRGTACDSPAETRGSSTLYLDLLEAAWRRCVSGQGRHGSRKGCVRSSAALAGRATARVLAAGLLFVLTTLLATAAEAQTPTTLVSNLEQVGTGGHRRANSQAFTTGNNASGYVLAIVSTYFAFSTR